MNYGRAVEYLYGLQQYGIKLGLDNPRKLLAALGNPERSFKSVHIAGTNGKGSTAAAIASVCRAAGNRTGLFTSPHLASFTERIRVNGLPISEEKVVELTERLMETASGVPDFTPTFFEVVTAMGFLHFRDSGVTHAAVETGMGGRLDATNTIENPEAVIITTVGIDHRQYLGETLPEIAAEKAGIIKKSVPLVLGPQKVQALEVLEGFARDLSCPVYLCGRDFGFELKEKTPEGVLFDFRGAGDELKDVAFPLAGPYQAANASCAVMAALLLGYPEGAIREGLSKVELPGRLELVCRRPEIRLDGAHNPEAAGALALALRDIFSSKNRRVILIIGIMADKDISGILAELLPVAGLAIMTTPGGGRAAKAEALVAEAARLGFRENVRLSGSVPEALELARAGCAPGDAIVVTGSFYTAGEAKEILSGPGRLFDLRE